MSGTKGNGEDIGKDGGRDLSSPKPSNTLPRARVGRDVVAARIDEIAGRMRLVKWIPGVCHQELSAKWGVSISEIRRLANVASKLVLAEVSDRDTMAVTVSGTLSRVMVEGEDRDALTAAGQARELFALDAPKVLDPAVLVQSLPAAERVAWLQRQADGIRRALASLLPRSEYLAALEAEVVARQEEIGELRREGEET